MTDDRRRETDVETRSGGALKGRAKTVAVTVSDPTPPTYRRAEFTVATPERPTERPGH
jgi:hypothetical protein